MRRFVRFAALFAALAAVTVATALANPVSHADAPADEYFGAQKQSALGIRMRIDALGRRYHARTIADDDLMHDATIAEASFFVWRARYPHDSWLAPTAFHLEQLFQAVQTPAARTEATKLLHVVATSYPKTTYAHQARARLAAGFPAFTPETAVTSTPSPYASGTPSPVTPDASASPAGAPPASASPAGKSSPSRRTA